ncbi:MAG TPA: CHAD domain-containing protein [Acidimicrobiales bacterium]
MKTPAQRFKMPFRVSDRSVVETLRDRWSVRLLDASKARRTYLDTADSRVLRAGWALGFRPGDSGSLVLELSSAADDNVLARCAADDPPQWARDLPDGEPWKRLADAIGERRLLCRLVVESSTKRYAILDEEMKTTVRVLFERHLRPADGNSAAQRLRLVALSPVRGYEDWSRRVSKALLSAGLAEHDGCLITHLAGSTVTAPGSSPSQINVMRRSMPVGLAVSQVLASLRNEMVGNEQGVREQTDIEFLHDYRVASRRARSVLNQVKALLPLETDELLSAELRWLGTLTGPARDLDVQIADAHGGVENLEGMVRLLERRRAQAQVDLVAALDSPRYKLLLETWQMVEEAAAASSTSWPGSEPAGPILDRHIDRAHRRVLRRGKVIDDESPAEMLHDLRKKTKAFRYMLEMFAPLYTGSDLKTAIRELKALQDNLGEFQDSQVQAGAIRHLAEEMLEEKSGSASELMAMGRIADSLETRQLRARAEFANRFARFASPEVTKRYRRMFGSSRGVR